MDFEKCDNKKTYDDGMPLFSQTHPIVMKTPWYKRIWQFFFGIKLGDGSNFEKVIDFRNCTNPKHEGFKNENGCCRQCMEEQMNQMDDEYHNAKNKTKTK